MQDILRMGGTITLGTFCARILMAVFSYESAPLAEVLSIDFLLHVLIMAVITAVGARLLQNLLLDSHTSYPRGQLLGRLFAHMLGVVGMVLAFATVVGWVQLDSVGNVLTFAGVAVGVYAAVTLTHIIYYRRLSQQINKQINTRHKQKSE